LDIICNKEQLEKAVASCLRAVSTRTAYKLLEGINLRADGGALVMNCTDNEIGIECKLHVHVESGGQLTVEAKLFGDMVRRLPDSVVRIYSVDDSKVNIISGDASFELFTLKGDEFPPFPEVSRDTVYSIDQHLFKKMLQKTHFAISLDESRKALTGLLMEGSGGEITAVAVDGFRIALSRYQTEGAGNNAKGATAGTGAEVGAGAAAGAESAAGDGDDGGDGGGAEAGPVAGAGPGGVGGYVGGSKDDYGSGSDDIANGDNGGDESDNDGGGDSAIDGGGGKEESVVKGGSEGIRVIIPGKTVNELMRIIPSSEGKLYLYGSRNQMIVEFDNCRVYTGIIEGEFFNYKYIVPEQTVTDVVVRTIDLLEAIERASLIISTEFIKRYPILLNVLGEAIEVKSTSNLGAVDEKVKAEAQGKDLEVAFNPRFLADALKSIEDEYLKISFTSEVGQCLLRPVDNDSFVHLILPVKRMADNRA